MTDRNEYASGSVSAPPAPPPAPPATGTPTGPLPPDPQHKGGGATVGIVLILLGAALLASRVLPGISLWMLWPLFIIVPGIVQCLTPGSDGWSVYRFFDGLVTVAVGFIFLGNTTGYLSWGVWWQILMLWPVLLISAGLSILGKSLSQGWLRVVGTLVVLLAFAYAAAISFAGTEVRLVGTPGGEPFSFSEPLAGAVGADLNLDGGVGEIKLDSGTDGQLISIKGESPFATPTFSATRSSFVAKIDFKLAGSEGVTVYPGSVSSRVDAELSGEVPWNITVDSGVSSLDADLSDLPVRSLTLKTGVSSDRVRLGAVPQGFSRANVRVDAGISSVSVLVPRGVEARVESQSGLTGHDIGSGFSRVGSGWQTAGFDAARSSGAGVWIITVKSGIGSFAVDTY